jgi:hypothetical protein
MSTGLFFVRRERMRTTTADLLVASNDGVELPDHLDSAAAVHLERLEAGFAGRGLHLAPAVELLELYAHLPAICASLRRASSSWSTARWVSPRFFYADCARRMASATRRLGSSRP